MGVEIPVAFSKASMRSRSAEERIAAGDCTCIEKRFLDDVQEVEKLRTE